MHNMLMPFSNPQLALSLSLFRPTASWLWSETNRLFAKSQVNLGKPHCAMHAFPCGKSQPGPGRMRAEQG
jgi:hypothetical protein